MPYTFPKFLTEAGQRKKTANHVYVVKHHRPVTQASVTISYSSGFTSSEFLSMIQENLTQSSKTQWWVKTDFVIIQDQEMIQWLSISAFILSMIQEKWIQKLIRLELHFNKHLKKKINSKTLKTIQKKQFLLPNTYYHDQKEKVLDLGKIFRPQNFRIGMNSDLFRRKTDSSSFSEFIWKAGFLQFGSCTLLFSKSVVKEHENLSSCFKEK